MFDSVPQNLPVEPQVPMQSPPPPPPAAPVAEPSVAPPAAPLRPMSQGGRKEPEDIFAGIERSPEPQVAPMGVRPSGRGFPFKTILIVLLSLALLGGIGWAVWAFVLRPTEEPAPPMVTIPVAPPVEIVEQPPVIEAPVEPVTTPPAGINIPAPQPIETTAPQTPTTSAPAPVPAQDTDNDALMDAEEASYGTDPTKADTDGDTYLDGAEVTNLFSPLAPNAALSTNPNMMQDALAVWTFLRAKSWIVDLNPTDKYEVAIRVGDVVRFRLESRLKPAAQTMNEYLQRADIEFFYFKTQKGLDAYRSTDGTITYVVQGDKVMIVTYDMASDPRDEYQTSMRMLVNSLSVSTP